MSDKISNVQADLLQTLAETGFFSCANCNELLSSVICSVTNIGNVCKTCFKSTYMNKDYELQSLTSLTDFFLKEIKIPCKNKTNGCKWVSYNDAKKDHERTCLYSEQNCPFLVAFNIGKPPCDWKGPLNVLEEHFINAHKGSVFDIEANSSTFSFDLELADFKEIGEFRLLVTESNSFILKISLDALANCLKHVLYKTFTDETPNSYTIRYQAPQENRSFQLDAKLRPLDWLYNAPENMEIINLNGLQQINYDTKRLTLVLAIEGCQGKNTEAVESEDDCDDDEVVGCNCPVCLSLMRPPIYLCTRGHSICSKCKVEVTKCPKCKANMSSLRNFDLEDLLSKNEYACSYEEKGCDESLIFEEIIRHEKNCRFRVYKCPIHECAFNDTSEEIVKHLKMAHVDYVCDSSTTCVGELSSVWTDEDERSCFEHCLIYDGEVFYLTVFEEANEFFFGVEIIHGSILNSSKYKYTVTITSDVLIDNWKLIESKFCVGMKIDDLISRQENFIRFPTGFLIHYAAIEQQKENIHFEFQIAKV